MDNKISQEIGSADKSQVIGQMHDSTALSVEQMQHGSILVSGEGHRVIVYQSQRDREIEPTAKLGPNPYKGLQAFQETDGDLFFGRTEQIAILWEKLRSFYESDTETRLLPIFGPSGSGKSSLARAGLIPELVRRPIPGYDRARVAVLLPGTHPLEALAGVLAKIVTDKPLPAKEKHDLIEEMGDPNGLRRIADLLPDIASSPLVILVDQFEEIYTNTPRSNDKERDTFIKERDAFVENLLCAASDRAKRVTVIITLRSDFLGETHKHPQLNRLLSDRGHLVPAMNVDELREAIAKPAENAGRSLDEATIDRLVLETEGREGALPLLQFALTRIWDGLEAGTEPADTLKAIGGVGGALAGEAQRIYEGLALEEKAIARRVFVGLVQLGEGVKDTRRRVAIDGLVSHRESREAVKRTIERFAAPSVRLISLSAEGETETAEVTHEALFEHWQLLQEWLDGSREDIRFQRRLDEAARYWEEGDQPEGRLWRTPDLELLQEFVGHCGDDLTPVQMAFFQASERAEVQRKRQRQRLFAGVVAVAVAFAGLSGLSGWLAVRSERARRRAEARQWAALSGRLRSQIRYQETSVLLAVESGEQLLEMGEQLLDVDEVLRESLGLPLVETVTYISHDDSVNAVSFSPDGEYIATASLDNTARISRTDTGEEIARISHDSTVRTASFSPDGEYIATASLDNTARISRTDTGEQIARISHDDSVNAVSFSPDGESIATASSDGTARISRTDTGEEITRIFHDNDVLAVSFSPDGQSIATASSDGTARISRTDTGEQIARIIHDYYVWDVSFSPDGQYIATASQDRTARISRTDTGEEIARIHHDSSVIDVSFSPDGEYIATASQDRTARINHVHIDSLMEENCQRLVRNLTADEWQRYINKPLSQYRRTCETLPVHESVPRQAIQLAQREGRKNQRLALAILRRVGELQPNLDLNPDTEDIETDPAVVVNQALALNKRNEGLRFAHDGEREEAISAFQNALELDPNIDLNPDTEAIETNPVVVVNQVLARGKRDEGLRLARQGKLEEAISAFQKALELDPNIDLNPDTEAIETDPEAVAETLSPP